MHNCIGLNAVKDIGAITDAKEENTTYCRNRSSQSSKDGGGHRSDMRKTVSMKLKTAIIPIIGFGDETWTTEKSHLSKTEMSVVMGAGCRP